MAGTGWEALLVLRDAKLEIAFLAPVGAPGVADLPELRAFILIVLGILAIANEGNGVINFGDIGETALAVGLSDNT